LPVKGDDAAIQTFMGGLASRLKLDNRRKLWPNWIYRSDHVENAAKILNSGKLLSRALAEEYGCIVKDSGSPKHVAVLTDKQRRLVRLYFRPCTPTQYANEGIRPESKITYQAHMPVPVYLLFSVRLLSDRGVQFSRGRLTPQTDVGDSAEFLASMNFTQIYHDGSVGPPGDPLRSILNARHSEALVADWMPLDHLKHIVCRAPAERDTLLNLLDSGTRERWEPQIVFEDGQRRMFHREWTFIREAHLSRNESVFAFHFCSGADRRGPFQLDIEWYRNSPTDRFHRYKADDFTVPQDSLTCNLPESEASGDYFVSVRLNGDRACLGRYRESDLWAVPF